MDQLEWTAKTRAHITINEARKRRRYFDSLGHPSIGIGFNLERQDAPELLRKLGVANWVAVIDGDEELTDPQVDQLFDWCFADALSFARKLYSNFDALIPEAQTVLVDMSFQMRNRLKGFVKMNKAVAALEYLEMINEMRQSLYAKQCPGRVARNAALIESGMPVSREGTC
jgi:hypothetical protein